MKERRKHAARRVEVVWLDSLVVQGTWHGPHELAENLDPNELAHCSVGYVAAENEHAIVLATSTNRRGDVFAGCIAIPKCSVVDGPRDL